MSDAQAALGRSELALFDPNLAHRRRSAERFRTQLAPSGFRLPEPPDGSEPAYVRYPVWVEDKSATVGAMAPRVVLVTWFTSVSEEAEPPRYGGYVDGSCPWAEAAARLLVNLPTYPRVTEGDAAEIAARLAECASPVRWTACPS